MRVRKEREKIVNDDGYGNDDDRKAEILSFKTVFFAVLLKFYSDM